MLPDIFLLHIQARSMSGKSNVFGEFMDKVKQGVAENKDLQVRHFDSY